MVFSDKVPIMSIPGHLSCASAYIILLVKMSLSPESLSHHLDGCYLCADKGQ